MSGSFANNLIDLIRKKKSIVCIGLDPNFEGKKCIPNYLLKENDNDYNKAIFEFNKEVIEKTCDLAPIYKPQSAFYEKYGAMDALKKTIEFIKRKGNLSILDAKRNDIGNTSQAYAISIFEDFKADSTTINGYLGTDCIKPFMDYQNKGLFVLVKTSNKSSGEFQDQWVLESQLLKSKEIDEKNGYLKISDLSQISELKCIRNYILMARLVKNWSDISIGKKKDSKYSNIGAVVGATYPEQMKIIRAELPNSFFLIPGYGAQGGTAKDIMNGINEDGLGAIVNSSRGINYAYVNEIDGISFKEQEFGEAARAATEDMRNDINTEMEDSNKIHW